MDGFEDTVELGLVKHVVVIGGGISGLSVAHRLIERAAEIGEPPSITVLEADDRLGGQVRTERHDGFLFETGADSLLAQKPQGIALCRRLGLASELEDVGARHTGIQILHRNRLVRVPDGFLMMAPMQVGPLLGSPLFSMRGKIRMLMEPFIPRRSRDVDDEGLASFVVRRFGREALERVAEPVIAGLYTADADRLSLRMTMPRFLDLEMAEGSVLRGLRRAKRAHGSRPFGHGTGGGGFVAIRGGLGRLIEALAARLPEGAVRVGTRVESLRRAGSRAGFSVGLPGGVSIDADAAVLACPAHQSSEILSQVDPVLARDLDVLSYASCATVHLIYRRAEVRESLSSFGFFVPRTAGSPLLACSYVSEKFEGRAPADAVVLRAFLGGATRPEILARDDETIAGLAHTALQGILGLPARPQSTRVHRHVAAMPQFDVGDREVLSGLVDRVEQHPGLFVAGSLAGAVGIPDCVRVAEEVAERVTDRFVMQRQAASVP